MKTVILRHFPQLAAEPEGCAKRLLSRGARAQRKRIAWKGPSGENHMTNYERVLRSSSSSTACWASRADLSQFSCIGAGAWRRGRARGRAVPDYS